MLTALENRLSWVTQRLANRYPPWAKIRRLAQSVGQQILAPAGRELEDYYWWSNYNLGNYLLNTSDLNQFDGIRRLDLPSSFEFRTEQQANGVVYLVPSAVKGKINSQTITLTQATNNSLEEFWYSPPDRILAEGTSYVYASVLSSTVISSLSSAILTTPQIVGKLWVTLSDNGSSIKNYKGKVVRSSVKLGGRDIHGREVSEKIVFSFNGTIQTKNAWSEVNSVTTEYVDDIASLRIDWLNIGQTQFLDHRGLSVTNDHPEKFRFWNLGVRSYGSTLKQLVFSADDLVLVQEGEDTKHAAFESQLLDSSGTNVNGLSLSSWPKRRWVIVVDGDKFHFYAPDPLIEDLDLLVEASPEAVVQIGLDKEWVTQGDTIPLDYNMKRPFVRVLRTRWSVKKPDGTIVGIAEDGSETVLSSSSWVNHPEGTTFKRLGFQGNVIDYTIEDKGRYVFYLETIITDLLTTEGQSRPTTQVDVMVIHSSYNTAEASVSLPVSIGVGSTVGFDAYSRPWVIDTNGTAHQLTFHHHKYLVDFTNKSIIVREEYDSLEVEA